MKEGEHNYLYHKNTFYIDPFITTKFSVDVVFTRIVASYRANYGAKGGTSKPVERIISTYLDINVWQEFVEVNFQIGADLRSTESSNVGLGLRVQKSLF